MQWEKFLVAKKNTKLFLSKRFSTVARENKTFGKYGPAKMLQGYPKFVDGQNNMTQHLICLKDSEKINLVFLQLLNLEGTLKLFSILPRTSLQITQILNIIFIVNHSLPGFLQ